MSNIKISRKQFEKEIGKLDEKMQHQISMFGTPLEISDDNEIEIEVFPNRPDLLSYQGFKRSFLAFLGKKTGLKEYKLKSPEKDYHVIIDYSVAEVRPYTACAIVQGLKFDDNKIKFIPLESEREMSGIQILQRHPTGRDYAHLLEGKSKFPIFVDADGNILSMPPIINSHATGKITENTKDVFIECSGPDFTTLKKCLNILVTAMADMGGTIHQMELQYPKSHGGKQITPDLTPEKTKISVENTNKILGLDLNEKQIKQFLERMGYNYTKGVVEVPAWRTDFLHEVDLIEDVAIAYGYDNLIPEIPEISTIGEEDFKETIKRKISEILSGVNILGTASYHLTNKKYQFENMGITENELKKIETIEVEESKTEYNLLRKDLTHYLMKIFAENVDSEYPQKIFELGTIFKPQQGKISEEEHLAIAITPGNFTELKQILEYLAKMLGAEMTFNETELNPETNYFIDGRTASIKLNNKLIGYIGEIHPRILRNWKLKMPVALLEINLDEIFERLI